MYISPFWKIMEYYSGLDIMCKEAAKCWLGGVASYGIGGPPQKGGGF